MTLEEKIDLLEEKMQNINVLRFVMKSKVTEIVALLTEEQIDAHLATIDTYQASLAFKIEDAMNFANKLMIQFTTENIIMGITQDCMTGTVRKNLSEVIMCLITGSLYDAIHEIKLLPPEKKDPKYLTDARLLKFVNEIETYLEIPLSEDLSLPE